jgi:hypothetical protein
VFYPEDDRFLIERDGFVRHHDVGYYDLPSDTTTPDGREDRGGA